MKLIIKRLSPTSKLPIRGSKDAAGYDLHACLLDENNIPRSGLCQNGTITILAGQRALIPTGLAMTIPKGTYGRIAPRSGLAYKQGLDIMAGVVDPDYVNEINVVLINLGQHPFTVEHNMRIAQLILERIETPEIEEVNTLENTQRGMGGFGSTGL